MIQIPFLNRANSGTEPVSAANRHDVQYPDQTDPRQGDARRFALVAHRYAMATALAFASAGVKYSRECLLSLIVCYSIVTNSDGSLPKETFV